LGDEVKVHVPLTLQLSHFEDKKVLTRESIQLFVKVAIWWRIKDRDGLQDFYLLIDKEIHVATNTDMAAKAVDFGSDDQPDAIRKSPRRAELNAAERWMLTLVESSLRTLVSRTSVGWIISKNASNYLHAGTQHVEQRMEAAPAQEPLQDEGNHGMPEVMAKSLQEMLGSQTEKYGIEIDRIEIQEVRMPQEIQEAIDRVWKASLLPAQSSQEAIAKAHQIEAELGTVAKILGQEAAGAAHVAKNLQGMNFYGGVGPLLEQLMGNFSKTPDPQPQKLADGPPTPALQPGPEWTQKPQS
jgi:regulator of protease activity HflC (stomatin/prohibitin superfamily)